jgi:Peptidase M10 serralysin C terminal/Domain of unknown function (DUF4114)
MDPRLEEQVTFLVGVDAAGRVAETAYPTWKGAIPANYAAPSKAIKWGDPTPGTGATVTYRFDSGSGWTSEEKDAWQGGLGLWSAIANITFREITDSTAANFVIERGGAGAGAGAAFGSQNTVPIGGTKLSTPGATGSEIEVETTRDDFGPIGYDLAKHGGHPFTTVIHEIGHMIGIGHGGPYNADVDRMTQQFGPYDMTLWTLMSYISPHESQTKFFKSYPLTGTSWGSVVDEDNFTWRFEPLTPMMLDIIAVQRVYGVATSGPLAAGGVTFGFNSTIDGFLGRIYDFSRNPQPVLTLWSGGTGNTLDLSKYDQDAVINLTPGTFSSAGGKVNNIGIAFDTVIEKAIGGNGNDTITASDVASILIGGDGTDKLYGGAGNDVLTGGADADTFDPGGGLNILRDILSNMNSDTVFNFGQSTTIDIERILVGRSHLGVTQSGDDTTLSVGDTQVLLEGVFGGGEFMAVARGQGDDAHTMVTFEPFLPNQVEGVSTEARAINGIANEPFMTGDGTVRFSTTLESASSAFANSLGVYKVAADGTIFDVEIVFADTLHVTESTKNLGTPADGVKFGFFLIQNGFGAYGDLPDNLSFVMAGTSDPANLNNGAPITLMSATLGALTTTAVFHSFQTLNVSDAIQVLSGAAPGGKDLLVAFEDLPTATGDNDFQDVVIRIHTNQDDLFVV